MIDAKKFPVFSMGLSTYKVPMSLHANNRNKVIKALLVNKDIVVNNNKTVVVLQGGKSQNRNDTDHEPIFRQESYFHYLFGVKEPDCWGIIDLNTKKTILAFPRYPSEYATFMGALPSNDIIQASYGVDLVIYKDEMESYLEDLFMNKEKTNGGICGKILLLKGQNSDSGNWYIPPKFKSSQLDGLSDDVILFPILAEARVIKSNEEM